VPTLHVHGSADRRVAAPSVRPDDPRGLAAWARGNGATGAPGTSEERRASGTLRRVAFSGPTARSEVTLLLVEGAGHEWAGGPGGVTTREILSFFRAHPKPESEAAAPSASAR
jgi:poly(3-hydroxybutyrate) depolymerase